MIVAVNTRFLLGGELEGYGYFIKEVFSAIASHHPQHQFYFLFDRPCSIEFVFGKNVTPIIISPPARHPLLWKFWYDVRVPAVLKKIKADVFVSPDGFCSLKTKVPQCLVVHDLAFLHFPETISKTQLLFYKRYTPKFLQKAASIATVSEFSKKDIVHQYKIDAAKIGVVYSAAKPIFQPISFDDQTTVKEKYTDGKEYFLYTGAIHPRKNLINLLKAFSIFKKRQQSGMKLVLAGRLAWKNDEFLTLLKTYKYRSDVLLTGYVHENELVRITASAYALVYPSLFEGFGVPVLEAMQCGVPVLTSANTSMQEIGGDAALYFNPEEPGEIAEQMMLMYKDETLRYNLIKKGFVIAKKYSWKQTADLLWESILKAEEK
ncbi:MAG: glycosyltransferase family 1 protein [Bacteroidota bacterium]